MYSVFSVVIFWVAGFVIIKQVLTKNEANKNTRPLGGRPGVCEEEPRSQQEVMGGYCASNTSRPIRSEDSPVGRSR